MPRGEPLTMTRFRSAILLFLIFLFGFALRVYQLDKMSLWCDEMNCVTLIKLPLKETIIGLSTGATPLFYYLVMKAWCHFAGFSEFALRFPSAFFSALLIFIVYKFTKDLFSEGVGLTAALLYSLSTYSIQYAQEAKYYPLAWIFSLLSFYFFFRFVRQLRLRWLVGYVLAAACSMYTFYFDLFYILTHNILFFFFYRRRKPVALWMTGQLAIVILYLPWIKNFIYNMIHREQNGFITQPIQDYGLFFQQLFHYFWGLSLGEWQPFTWAFIVYVILACCALIAFPTKASPRWRLTWGQPETILLGWIFLPLIMVTVLDRFYPIFLIRYVGFLHIPLIILLSKGIWRFDRWARRLILGSLLLFIALCQVYPFYYKDQRITYQDWRGLFQRLESRVRPNDLVIGEIYPWMDLYYPRAFQIRVIEPLPESLDAFLSAPSFLAQPPDSIFVIDQWDWRYRPYPTPRGYYLKEYYSALLVSYSWFKKSSP